MINLIAFAQRRDVQLAVSALLDSPAVQGIVADYDPNWLVLWRLNRIDKSAPDRFFSVTEGWMLSRFDPEETWKAVSGTYDMPPDTSWMPPVWTDYCKAQGIPSDPIFLRVVLYPQPASPSRRPMPTPRVGFRIVFESRGPAVLTSATSGAGAAIGGGARLWTSDGSGTLGGVIQNAAGQKLVITCAHVAKTSQDVYVAQMGTRLGTCTAASQLVPCQAHDICNPYIQRAYINCMDAAIVRVDPALQASLGGSQLGTALRMRGKQFLTSGQAVQFVGAISGLTAAEIGGFVVCYRMQDHGGALYCMRDLFAIRKPARAPLFGFGPIIPRISTCPVQRGDSGGWLCHKQNSGYDWSGQVMAHDDVQGYALFADDVMQWVQQYEPTAIL